MGVSRVTYAPDTISSSHATIEKSSVSQHEFVQCDACPYCPDICENDGCLSCQRKQNRPKHLECTDPRTSWFMEALSIICPSTADSNDMAQSKTFTMCQLKRHNHADSAWILVGDAIYDATPYIRSHPGGTTTILRKAGGAADCSEDMKFHSKRAQKEWKKYRVGTLCRCPKSS